MTASRITLHYSGLSKSNFKDHYGDVVIKQCLGKIAEINEFSASDEMLSVTRQMSQCCINHDHVNSSHYVYSVICINKR